MKAKAFIAIAALLALGQGAWADATVSFPLHYDADSNREDGSKNNPYQIRSIDDLNTLASDVNSGTDYSGKYFKLTEDLDYSGVALFDTDNDGEADSNFKPIGYGNESKGANFKGIFYGNGKFIKGITVNMPSATGVGLFGYIHSPAEIRNLTLKDCSFTGNFEVGAIAGACAGSSDDYDYGIFNCTVGAGVTVTAVTSTSGVDELPGAFAGSIIGDSQNMKIVDCTSAATVKGTDCIGGIAGRLIGSLKDGNERSIIENSFFTGSIVGSTHTGNIVGARGPVAEYDESQGTRGLLKLTLYDADGEAIKNATRLSNYNGLEANVTLSGRTLYKDNSWNTLCLPFNLVLAGSPLEGATVKTLESSDYDSESGTLTLTFTDATTIEAGKPYIVKWASGTGFTPTFTGVTISSTTPTDATGTAANFHGIYSPYSTDGENKSMLYLGSSSKLFYPSGAMTINAFRAYFTLNGITAGESTSESSPAPSRFVLNLDGESAGIATMEFTGFADKAGAWYDMSGQRLAAQPTKSGVYINKGKKVLIK